MGSIYEMIFGNHTLYFGFAVVGSLILGLQLALALFGIGGHADFDADGDGDIEFGEHDDLGLGDFRFFSLRSIIAFITFFGWGGVIALGQHAGEGVAFLIALGSGLLMMLLTALMLYFLLKLQHSGNVTEADIVGCNGKVYLKIPGGETHIGKVTAEVAGTVQEIVAVANGPIERGAAVKVVKHLEGRRFLVEKAV